MNLWKGKYKQEHILETKTNVMKPLLKKYGHPVIVHAVEDKTKFLKILESGKIKLPKDHGVQKKAPLMEKILGVDNSIFLSVGFDYWVNYNFKFNLIFDWGILKESDYYWRPLPFKCYTAIVDWWYDNDLDYLYRLRDFNKVSKKVAERYLLGNETGNPLMFFEYWKMEEIVFDFVIKYPRKKKLVNIAKKMMGDLRRTYPYSKILVERDWNSNRCPEIIHHKEIDLSGSPCFLGFFIEGNVPRWLGKILKSKYKGKIIFDGERIEVL
jgi:hypothetical protein